ncbi:hypothetical protein M404DRAFT_151972 [Pisolithus tinctorius Marx 270]|uniref:Uncharacterized protein n=1 Tax=Pisolithus tinctorius Marx 270 TaxID=870435 RepID=A0A0C3NZZ6_PISTI|nr:hypothetical protein M404DRAFT_151972 [Pisolithus tinctorius Marx 270]
MSGPGLIGKSTRSSRFSLDDIINDPEAEIKNAELARSYLDQLYMVQGKPATPEHISYALFYILQTKGVNNTLRSAIRAAAYLVRELAVSAIADTVIKAISTSIENSVIAAISPQIAKILSTTDKLEKINKNTDLLNNNLTEKMELIANTTEYAKAHTAVKERQLLIDPSSNHPTLNDLSSRESIIEAIKLVLEAVEQADSPDLQLKSIMQLCNNGILLELNTQEASVAWIKEPTNKATFLVKLGGKVMIKNHHFSIVILFLPILTNTELPDTLHKMESKNNILHNVSQSVVQW